MDEVRSESLCPRFLIPVFNLVTTENYNGSPSIIEQCTGSTEHRTVKIVKTNIEQAEHLISSKQQKHRLWLTLILSFSILLLNSQYKSMMTMSIEGLLLQFTVYFQFANVHFRYRPVLTSMRFMIYVIF